LSRQRARGAAETRVEAAQGREGKTGADAETPAMRRIQTVLVSASLAAAGFAGVGVAGGCAHKPTLAGTWVGPHILPGGQGSVPSSITLREDGTFTTTAGTGSGASGTYSVSGSTITETFNSYTVNGRVQAIPPQAAVTQSGTFRLDGDTLTLTIGEDSAPNVLRRSKS